MVWVRSFHFLVGGGGEGWVAGPGGAGAFAAEGEDGSVGCAVFDVVAVDLGVG